MSKKLVFMCLALAMGLVSIGYADPIIGSWENQNQGWFDWGNGERIDSATNMPSKYTYSDAWSSVDDYSLQITKPGYNQNLAIRSYESSNPSFVSEFLANNAIAIDLYFNNNEWKSGDWAQIYELAIQGTGVDWASYALGAANETDTGNPGSPGQWGYGLSNLSGGGYKTTITWNYSAEKATMVAAGLTPASGYVNFIFATNCNSDSVGIFRIDNVRFVPEPATMTLFGLGALALLRRKR